MEGRLRAIRLRIQDIKQEIAKDSVYMSLFRHSMPWRQQLAVNNHILGLQRTMLQANMEMDFLCMLGQFKCTLQHRYLLEAPDIMCMYMYTRTNYAHSLIAPGYIRPYVDIKLTMDSMAAHVDPVPLSEPLMNL